MMLPMSICRGAERVIDTPLAELRCHLLCRLAMQDGYIDAELQLVLAIDDHLLTRRKAGIDERLPVAGTVTSRIQYIRGGMLRALAVTTAKRQEPLPDVPTVGEFLPGFEARLVRDRRAQSHAHGDCREAQQRDQCCSCRSQHEETPNRSGSCGVCRFPRRLWKVHRRRNREVAQGGQVCRHQGGIITCPTFVSFSAKMSAHRTS